MSILNEADALVNGDRQSTYGPPGEEFERVGMAWTALFSRKLEPGASITGHDVALAMVSLKLIRETYKPKTDNRRDAAGYLLVADKIVTHSRIGKE